MLTKDDLEQIGKVIDNRLQAEREQTKKIVQGAKDDIIQMMGKETKTIAGFFHTTWQKYDDHEERIEKLEEDQLSTHKN
jgi:hypothetical protein